MRWLLVTCLFLACAEPQVEAARRTRDALLASTPDTSSTSVFYVYSEYFNGATRVGTGICTGTLISPRVVLTAGHCADAARESAQTVVIKVMNKPDDTMLMMGDLKEVMTVRRHPQYSGQGPNDLALLQLTAPIDGVTPELLVRASPPSWNGQPLRLVGYGRTRASGTSDSGTRRAANLTVSRATAETLEFGQAGVAGICGGDSGGPSFWRGPDGKERVAGVHSFGTSNQCGVGGDVRVDAELAFIEPTLNQLDPPACGADGRCQSGCTPVDPDCRCIADSRCELCTDGRIDPDCPVTCVMDGVCQNAGCAAPDPDCLADGDVCASAAECTGTLCLEDSRGFSFCSRPCSDDTTCTRELTCQQNQCRATATRSTGAMAESVVGGCSTAPFPSGLLTLLVLFGRRPRNPARRA